jgi:hypothetical protein
MKPKRRGKKISTNCLVFGCFGCCALLLGLGRSWWLLFRYGKVELPRTSVERVPKNPGDWHHKMAEADAVHKTKTSSRKPSMATTSTATAGFVHMGKTAGSTLSMLLRNGCHSFVKPKPCHVVTNETMVSRLVGAYYHIPDFQYLKDSDHSIYILSVRDVYDRFVSSLLYQHPKNVEYYHVKMTRNTVRYAPMAYKCFPTLEVFASFLKRGNSTDCYYPYPHYEIVNENCAELACAVSSRKFA